MWQAGGDPELGVGGCLTAEKQSSGLRKATHENLGLETKMSGLDPLSTGSMLLKDCSGPDLARLQPLQTAVGSFNIMAPAWPWGLSLLHPLKEQPRPVASCLQQPALQPLLLAGSVPRGAPQPGRVQ